MQKDRKHTRLPILSVTFIELESPAMEETDSGKLAACKSLNVSQGGLQVELEEDITVGALLQVCVELPNADDPLYLVGEVRWCRPGGGEEGPWVAGFQLMNAVNSDIGHWRDLVERLES
jgi:Tfp pilus assembly protein PilZ